jgi:hypothetical protein
VSEASRSAQSKDLVLLCSAPGLNGSFRQLFSPSRKSASSTDGWEYNPAESRLMAIYQIAGSQPTSPGERVRSQLVRTGFFLVLYVPIWRAVHGQWLSALFVAILGVAIFLGNLLTTSLWPRKAPRCALDIDDDENRLIWSGKVMRRVRRAHVRYVREWGSGPFRRLVVSERGPVFTRWLWGGIGVPASLPEYEQIKTQALTWLDGPGK